MCDTLVALGNVTADGHVLFAKNSDREPNEAQALVAFPRMQYAPGEHVQCTYIAIPQVRATHAVLLSQPFWMWGAEMGLNEHGVVIGNEAVFCKEPYGKKPALLGMDLLRLALERGATAREALDSITQLLAAHGQGGNGGLAHKLYYHNTFIIADPKAAWVLETVGKHWAAIQVRDVYTLSNGLTIGSEWDLASPRVVEHAIERGWCRSAADFHFARCYSDRIYTHFSGCRVRQPRSTALLRAQMGAITPQTMMAALRDHGPEAVQNPNWRPAPGGMRSLCVHAGAGPMRASQSVASFVAHLDPNLITAWVTASSAPCTGIFKPVYLSAGLPDGVGLRPGAGYDPAALWWRHECLHRAVLMDYAPRIATYRAARDQLEAEFITAAARHSVCPDVETLANSSATCFSRADAATERWLEQVQALPLTRKLPPLYRHTWRKYSQKVDMRISE